MSNVNKVASFSRLRNEHIPSNTVSRKGREIQHPLNREIEKLIVLPDSAWEIEKSVANGRTRTGDLSDVKRAVWPTELSDPADLREISVCMTLNL